MSESALAKDTNQPHDATATQGEAAKSDAQPAPEQSQVDRDATTEQDVAKALYDKEEEPKPDESKTDAEPEKGEAEEKTEDKPEGAPEEYSAFRVPEGMPEDFELDGAVSDALKAVSRELDLPQESAQKLVDQVLPVINRRTEEQHAEIQAQWLKELKADKDIGGQKLDENLGIAKKAVEVFGNEGARALLLEGPLGSHPEVIRFLVNVGQTVSEDKFVGGKQAGESVDPNDPAAVAKQLYPTSAT